MQMESLTLAAVSLTIAVSLMISKNKTPVHQPVESWH
jgi:hypothetical protein